MRTVLLTTTDPAFNLAAEEYLLMHTAEEIRMLWRNDRSVIIGKNQNAWAEVNLPYTRAEGIPVVRRMTGGGAVFHDPGNVNYTLITDCDGNGEIDFARFTAPIVHVLETLGVPAVLSGRNDLLVDGVKISGNAQAVIRRPDGTARRLHHGTILFGADLAALAEALVVHPEKIRAKGIGSVRSRVTNLRDLPAFPAAMTVERFVDILAAELSEGEGVTALSAEEITGITALREEKYAGWEWNFGRSANHTTEYTVRYPFGTVSASYAAAHGVITDIRLWGDYFGTAPIEEIEAALVGAQLRRDSLAEAIRRAPHAPAAYIAGATAEDIISLLLGEHGETETKL